MDTVLSPEFPTIDSVFIPIEEVDGFVGVARDVLTPAECNAVISVAESAGFSAASFYTDPEGREHYSEIRKSQRCILDSHVFAERLWARIRPLVPAKWGDATVIGLNERHRILKYLPGDEFKPHMDGRYYAADGSISALTVLLYLNEGYEGGFTCFHTKNGDWYPIPPTTGAVAIQDQSLLHGVPPLQTGIKYALRTEVMIQHPRGEYKVCVVKE
jgi:hypothetical protein